MQSPTKNNISFSFQNLSIASEKEYDDRFGPVIKIFQPKILFAIDEFMEL